MKNPVRVVAVLLATLALAGCNELLGPRSSCTMHNDERVYLAPISVFRLERGVLLTYDSVAIRRDTTRLCY